MGDNKEGKGIIAGIAYMAAMVVFVVVAFLLIALSFAGVGYLIGMVFMVAPVISGAITEGLPVSAEQIPGIMAWIFIFTFMTALGNIPVNKEED